MICLLNDESEVINNPFLTILKAEIGKYLNINNIITNVEFEQIEILL